MAAITLTGITAVNLERADTYEIDFVSGHTVGDLVKADGTVSTADTDAIAGIIIQAGDADGHKSLVLVGGLVEGLAGAGAAANATIFADGANAASDTEPANGVGAKVTVLGEMISATRAWFKIYRYELEA